MRRNYVSWNRVEVNDERLINLYVNQRLTVEKVAQILGVNTGPIYRRLRELRAIRSNSEAHLGHRPPNFKGRFIESRNGYVVVHVHPDSPYASMAIMSGSGTKALYVREHRLVMAEHIGRPLERWEVVHHKNHVRDDNRIENLELISSQSQHHGETIMHNELLLLKAENAALRDEVASLRANLAALAEHDPRGRDE
jgi:hypothetical protein